MRFALHKMFEVFGLSMGDLLYEEYVLGNEELHPLKKDAPKCMRPIGRSTVISIFVLKQPAGGSGELSIYHGLTTSSRV